MLIIIQILMLLVLMAVAVQDFQSRSVYWFMYPVMAGCFLYMRHVKGVLLIDIFWGSMLNFTVMALQFIMVTVYFSVKRKQIIRLTDNGIGWGDILFILTTAFYLSAPSFLLYYVGSLIFCLISWLTWQWAKRSAEQHIPLAGFQALFLVVILIIDWWVFPFLASFNSKFI